MESHFVILPLNRCHSLRITECAENIFGLMQCAEEGTVFREGFAESKDNEP